MIKQGKTRYEVSRVSWHELGGLDKYRYQFNAYILTEWDDIRLENRLLVVSGIWIFVFNFFCLVGTATSAALVDMDDTTAQRRGAVRNQTPDDSTTV